MTSPPATVIAREVFSGWKEIANYLGRGVRTVQRYEEELQLPVRRPAAKRRGSVIAIKAELDGWVLSNTIREFPAFERRAPNPSQFGGVNLLMVRIQEMKRLYDEGNRLRNDLSAMRERFHESMQLIQSLLADHKIDKMLKAVERSRSNLLAIDRKRAMKPLGRIAM
jgi:hypothetical protein